MHLAPELVTNYLVIFNLKMVNGCHLEKLQYLHNKLSDFDEVWSDDASWPS